jgi:hypothetical protein
VLAQELVTGHTNAAPAPATKAAIASGIAANEGIEPLPEGTPTDDYQFMGWCTGILTGHMNLYPKVKPQLDVISQRWNSVDEDNKQQAAQQIEGRALLARFRRVMATAEAAKPSLGPEGQAAVQKGLDSWSGVDKIDKQAQAYSWMNFGFPVQCESKVGMLEKTPINVTRVAVSAPVSKASAASKAASPKAPGAPRYGSLKEFIIGDGSAAPVGTQTEIAPGVIADPNRSLVTQLAEQKAAEKKKKADKAAAEKAQSAADAGLRK